MLAKHWKRILLIILIILCLINAIMKLVRVVSFNTTLENIKSRISITQKVDKNK